MEKPHRFQVQTGYASPFKLRPKVFAAFYHPLCFVILEPFTTSGILSMEKTRRQTKQNVINKRYKKKKIITQKKIICFVLLKFNRPLKQIFENFL